jgi:hypothetical protein
MMIHYDLHKVTVLRTYALRCSLVIVIFVSTRCACSPCRDGTVYFQMYLPEASVMFIDVESNRDVGWVEMNINE